MPTLTWQCDRQVDRVLRQTPSGGRIVDLGAGGRKLSRDTICVDFIPFDNTSILADVHKLPFQSGTLDTVFATGLLEHVEDARTVLQEIARVVRPGGVAHVEVPFLQQYHEDPIDCRRYTIPGLRRELLQSGLTPTHAGFHIGPTVAIITLFTYYVAMWFNGRSLVQKVISTAVFTAMSVLLWPAKYLDALAMRCSDAHRLCFGVYCTAQKPLSESRAAEA